MNVTCSWCACEIWSFDRNKEGIVWHKVRPMTKTREYVRILQPPCNREWYWTVTCINFQMQRFLCQNVPIKSTKSKTPFSKLASHVRIWWITKYYSCVTFVLVVYFILVLFCLIVEPQIDWDYCIIILKAKVFLSPSGEGQTWLVRQVWSDCEVNLYLRESSRDWWTPQMWNYLKVPCYTHFQVHTFILDVSSGCSASTFSDLRRSWWTDSFTCC